MGMIQQGQSYQQTNYLNLERLAKFWELDGLPLRRFAAKTGMGPWDARRYLMAQIDYPLWRERNRQYVAKQKASFEVNVKLRESRLSVGKILVAEYICTLALEEGPPAVSALEYLISHPTHREIDTWYAGLYELFSKIEGIRKSGKDPKITQLLGGSISNREVYRIGHEIGIRMRTHKRKNKKTTKSNPAVEQSSDSSQGQPII